MKVVHITPTYFDDSSVIGGGERYPTELSGWMAKSVDTTLVSFASQRKSDRHGDLKIEVYPVKRFIHGNKVNPLSIRYLSAIREADIVHIHHVHTLVSDLACLAASWLGKRTFVTDYGGGASLVLNQKLPVLNRYQKAIVYSKFGAGFLSPELKDRTVLIKGGIDTTRFCPDASLKREKKILYVGRILPHKGINYLIEGFRLLKRPDFTLRIIGRVYSEDFYNHLRELVGDHAVEFVHDANDHRLLYEYRTALATVLPSVYTTYDGSYTPVPELMGFTLLESQACGTPVVCTDAGAMGEFVDHERTGFIVEQNSGEAIAAALRHLINLPPTRYAEYESRCRELVKSLDWSTVVREHLRVYEDARSSARHISQAA
ncbi:MAG: glycosyltransferase family 4 protein [Pyrinomonadaceae bacterium]|nr:glycosyltransferase family 4 protein [Pyrinomonadaceae bacterium]